MGPTSARTTRRLPVSIGLRVAVIYGVLGTLWIGFSDRLVTFLAADSEHMAQLQTYKGWGFIAVTAVLLWILVRGYTRHLERERSNAERLNRVYQVLSGINGAILRVRDRPALLQTACEIAVNQGGYALARIVTDEIVQTGPAQKLAEALGRPLALGMEPARPVFLHDLDDASLSSVERNAATACGVCALAALPIASGPNHVFRGWFELYSRVPSAFDEDEQQLLADVAADIGLGLEAIEQADRVYDLTHLDQLTGLPNERLLLDRLKEAIARARYDKRFVAVIAVALPDLHSLAGARGRHFVDELIRSVGDHMLAAVREGDTVARTGPNEFMLVLNQMASRDDLLPLAERLTQGLRITVDMDRPPVRLTIRGGAAIFPSDAEEPATLVQRAKLALHASGANGDGCVFYSPEMNAAAQTRINLEHALQQALERNEFYLVYQLLFDPHEEASVGAEALLRWHNETLGEVGPDRFIPVAESSGMIRDIGHWVLVEGCRQVARWHMSNGNSPYLAVNVSAHQLLANGFTSEVQTTLEGAGINPDLLVFEITETAILHDLEHAIEVLKAIRNLGVRVYLDDFGTGYSSLSYLSRLPVDAVKIDRSFIRSMPDDNRAALLVKAIIGLVHGLGLTVVAEGVETEEQLQMLCALDCDVVQGYLFNRPERPEQLTLCPLPLQSSRAHRTAGRGEISA